MLTDVDRHNFWLFWRNRIEQRGQWVAHSGLPVAIASAADVGPTAGRRTADDGIPAQLAALQFPAEPIPVDQGHARQTQLQPVAARSGAQGPHQRQRRKIQSRRRRIPRIQQQSQQQQPQQQNAGTSQRIVLFQFGAHFVDDVDASVAHSVAFFVLTRRVVHFERQRFGRSGTA